GLERPGLGLRGGGRRAKPLLVWSPERGRVLPDGRVARSPQRLTPAVQYEMFKGVIFMPRSHLLRLGLPATLFVAGLLLSWPLDARPADTTSNGEPKVEKLWVYVGTYTGGPSKGIYRLDLDLATGKLSEPVLAAETANPSFLAIHPNRRFL